MKKLVVRRSSKPMVVPSSGKFRGKKVYLLKRGFSGWHGTLENGEMVYVFNEEIQ